MLVLIRVLTASLALSIRRARSILPLAAGHGADSDTIAAWCLLDRARVYVWPMTSWGRFRARTPRSRGTTAALAFDQRVAETQ